jgi:molybdopterin-guanine dinucleotide biosynthesis protein A
MFSLALLSGGISGRMGQDKALMPFLGRPLILRILERLSSAAGEVILSTNHPADYGFLGLPLYPDLLPGCGALGGLYTSLNAAQSSTVAAVACDMPFASPTLFEY